MVGGGKVITESVGNDDTFVCESHGRDGGAQRDLQTFGTKINVEMYKKTL